MYSAFRAAIESEDVDAAVALFAPDAAFQRPCSAATLLRERMAALLG